jgi:hypothetical protein
MRFALFGAVVDVIFTVFVTVFAASADAKAVRNLPKWVWILLCLFLSPIGGILYLIVGRPLPNSDENKGTRTVAPDDDPDFLRDLAKRMREEDEGKK